MSALTRLLALLALGLTLSGCGGGGGSDGGSGGAGGGGGATGGGGSSGGGSAGPQLTTAATYGEFVDSIQTRYPGAFSDFPLVSQYDNALESYPQYMAVTNLDKNPIAGVWKSYAQQDYPTPNAKLEFVDTGSGRNRMQYRDLDLTNNSTANGGAQAFWGVTPPYPGFDAQTYKEIWVSILAEVIIQDAARVPQYRALKRWIGILPNSTGGTYAGPPSDGIVGHLFIGSYRLTVLECFVASCVAGSVLEYTNYMDRRP